MAQSATYSVARITMVTPKPETKKQPNAKDAPKETAPQAQTDQKPIIQDLASI